MSEKEKSVFIEGSRTFGEGRFVHRSPERKVQNYGPCAQNPNRVNPRDNGLAHINRSTGGNSNRIHGVPHQEERE